MERTTFSPALSFWEIKEYLQDIDLLVVGSGIVGLTTAIFFMKQHPNAKVVVVERGVLPSGASTKNAGFACFGSVSEILADLKTTPEPEVFSTISRRIEGLRLLRDMLGDKSIGFEVSGGYEVFRTDDTEIYHESLDNLDRLNQQINELTGLKDTYAVGDDHLEAFGFTGVQHLILNRHEGAIDTAMMMRSLIDLAHRSGITILNGMELKRFETLNDHVQVEYQNGWTMRCGHLHIATNGFAKALLPQLDVKPARAQVLITKPIENLRVRGTFHMHEGYYYFRNVGNRLLFGGGRHLDMEKETTSEMLTTELIQHDLETKLREIIIPGTNCEIEHRWAGIMGVGSRKMALVKELSSRVTCAVRMGGMGVAIGTSIGKQGATMIGS